jgi:hypothetical protein
MHGIRCSGATRVWRLGPGKAEMMKQPLMTVTAFELLDGLVLSLPGNLSDRKDRHQANVRVSA